MVRDHGNSEELSQACTRLFFARPVVDPVFTAHRVGLWVENPSGGLSELRVSPCLAVVVATAVLRF